MKNKSQKELEVYYNLLHKAIIYSDFKAYEDKINYYFLYSLEQLLDNSSHKLNRYDKDNLYNLIDYLRFKKEYKNGYEKELVFDWCNKQIDKINKSDSEELASYLKKERYAHIESLVLWEDFINARNVDIDYQIRILNIDDLYTWEALNSERYYEGPFPFLVADESLYTTLNYLIRNYNDAINDEIRERIKELLLVRYKLSLNALDSYAAGKIEPNNVSLKGHNYYFDEREMELIADNSQIDDTYYLINKLYEKPKKLQKK